MQTLRALRAPSVFTLAALAAVCLLGMAQARKRPGLDAPCGMLVVRSEEDLAGLNARVEAMAKAGGGQVYVPAGTYHVHEPIMLRDNVTVRGDGPGTVLIASERFDEFLREKKVYGSTSDVTILFCPRGSHFGVLNVKGASGVRIYDLAMRGNREKVRAAAGVIMSRARDVLVRGVSATNCGGSGFNVLRSRDVTLSQLTSTYNHNGVIISGPGNVTQNISVTDCRIADNRWSGIYMCGDGTGAAKATNGPSNLVIANNFVFRHMCDEGIKAFGVSDTIVTGNRVDYALEATISVRGQNTVIANNICSHGDDGMNNKGNGVAIHYGNRGSDRINAVIQGNICAECNSGIWSEGFQMVKGKAQPLGRVAIVGNVCVDNVTAGIGQVMKTDLACVGNVCVDNGHSLPDPKSPAQDNMGIMVGGGTRRTVLVGNVIADTRPEGVKRLEYGLLLRGCNDGFACYNHVSGCKDADIEEQHVGTNYLNEKNGDDWKGAARDQE